MSKVWRVVSVVLLLGTLLSGSNGPAEEVQYRARIGEGLRSRPAMFIENVGQFAEGARFRVYGGGHDLWPAEGSLWITGPGDPTAALPVPSTRLRVSDGEGTPRHP